MVSPRLRPAVPLPAPPGHGALRRVLATKIVLTLGLWAAPALLLPPPWFPVFGIPQPPLTHLVFVRLLGAAYVALVVAYALAWRTPARHPAAILTGVVSNGLAAVVIVRVGLAGGFADWPLLGACYMWLSAALTAALAVALVVTGRPLLRKVTERPRVGSVKVV